jgi:hypothetical protein
MGRWMALGSSALLGKYWKKLREEAIGRASLHDCVRASPALFFGLCKRLSVR